MNSVHTALFSVGMANKETKSINLSLVLETSAVPSIGAEGATDPSENLS